MFNRKFGFYFPISRKHDLTSSKIEKLFNGKDLSNWNFVVDKNSVPAEQVFSVKDGLIQVAGQPFGYMYTKEKYGNYKLHVEWRWPDGKTANSGIFLLIEEPKIHSQMAWNANFMQGMPEILCF